MLFTVALGIRSDLQTCQLRFMSSTHLWQKKLSPKSKRRQVIEEKASRIPRRLYLSMIHDRHTFTAIETTPLIEAAAGYRRESLPDTPPPLSINDSCPAHIYGNRNQALNRSGGRLSRRKPPGYPAAFIYQRFMSSTHSRE